MCSVRCVKAGCDRTWPRDPALEVPCPTCQARAGAKCKRPSGHSAWQHWVHAERDLAAEAAGHYGQCPLGVCYSSEALKHAPHGLPPAAAECDKEPVQLRLF